MRFAVLAASMVAFAVSAEAGSLTLIGPYGDDYGCKIAALGEEKVVGSGVQEPGDWLLVDAKGAQGHEWSCDFRSVRGTKVVASCANGGDSHNSKQTVTVIERRAYGTLVYADMAGTYTLHRCRI